MLEFSSIERTSRAALFLNLSLGTWSRQESPFQSRRVLPHTQCGFPHHLLSNPIFKEAAEFKSTNNVNRGFKNPFTLKSSN